MQPLPVLEGGPFPLSPEQEGEEAVVLEYGVVVDAGSSGSRARVYEWPKRTDQNTVPNITEVRECVRERESESSRVSEKESERE